RHGVATVRSTCNEKRGQAKQSTGTHADAPFDLNAELRSDLRAVHQLASLHSELRGVGTPSPEFESSLVPATSCGGDRDEKARQCPAALLSPPRYCPRRTTSAPALDRASLGARQVALERERRLLIHEAVALDRHAAVRAQRAIFTEEEPAIVHVVHQVHPEPGGEREEGGALAAALTQPASMVCRQVVQE